MKRLFGKKTLLALVGTILFVAAVPADDWKAPSSAILEAARMPPMELSKSKWLWSSDEKNTDQKSCYYRFRLDLKKPVKSVEMVGYLDDAGTVCCNGQAIKSSRFEQKNTPVKARKYILTPYIKPGKNLIAVEVRNDRHMGGMIFLGKITYADGRSEFFHTDANWKATSKLAAGQWMQPDFDDSRWPAAVPFGDVGQKPWFNLSDVANLCTGDDEKQKMREWRDNYYRLPDSLAGEKQRVYKIVWKNGLPAFSDGSREYPPQVFRFHFESGINVERESDILLKVCMAGTHLVEMGISSQTIEREAGVYDFSDLDRQAGNILKVVPDASLMVHLRVDSLDEFLRKNPDEGIGYATGPADNKVTEIWKSLDVGGRKVAPSYASQKFRNEFCNFIIRFAEYIRNRPWSKRLVAVRVTNGCYSEWHYFGMAGQMPDTGKAMTRAFREFAREKYKTVEALRKAWHDDKVEFETVTVPGVEERWGKKRFLRDSGSADRKVMDYYICHQKMIADSVIAAAGAVKSVLPDVLVGTFYGYVLGMSQFPSEGQTLFLEQVLSSPHIDFLSSPYCYVPAARSKGGDGLLRMIPATFLRHNKLALNEMDIRTHRMKKPVQFTDVKTAEESAQVFLRDYALSELSGIGGQLVDLGLRSNISWFNDPKILTAIHTANSQWLAIRDAVKPQNNEVGAIFNPREMYLHAYPLVRTLQFNWMLTDQQVHALCKSGVPFDLMTLDDYLAGNRQYRVLVFLNAMTLTDGERTELKKRTGRPGVTVIWCYAPGLVSEYRWSEAAMAELTGMKLRLKDEKLPMALDLDALGKIGRSDVAESPRVYVDDQDALPMGWYEDRSVGMASKTLPGRSRCIFSAVPITASAVWAKLLQRSGAHAYVAPGTFIKVVNPFVLVHVAGAGSYPVRLPARAARVTDVYGGGKVIASDTDKVILTSKGCKTWLLKID